MGLLLDLGAQNDNLEKIDKLNTFINEEKYSDIINHKDFIDFINHFVEHEYGVAHKFIKNKDGKFEVIDEITIK